MKRSKSAISPNSDSESSQMSVDEAKEEPEEQPQGGDESGPMVVEEGSNEFLDSFYGLAAPDARTRSASARIILQRSAEDSKDAAYALKRLLNGLCSGRAAARQGNASALQSFVRLVDVKSIQQIEGNTEGELKYLRSKLLAATEPDLSVGKVKGMEERDYQFGRLFGILSFVRSGILLSTDEDPVVLEFVNDLIELYNVKSWMREPSAHAIGILLQSFSDDGEENDQAKTMLNRLTSLLVPSLLEKGDSTSSGEQASALSTYSVEQVALLANIQANSQLNGDLSGVCSKEPAFSVETIAFIADALVGTSSVTQPRTHLVWDALWLFLTERDEALSSDKEEVRKLRPQTPVGGESCADVLEFLVNSVVRDKLVDSTHERRSLALCLVRNLLGVEFVSSVTGRTRLALDSALLERTALSPVMIQKLFLDVICASGGSQDGHMLKPLATHVLEQAAAAASSNEQRLTFAKALLRCDCRFDGRTKTNAVARSLRFGEPISSSTLELWQECVTFLEGEILSSVESNSNTVLGLADMLFQLGKTAVQVRTEDETVQGATLALASRIISFFAATSFFDCSSIKKPKKKKGSHSLVIAASNIEARRSSEALSSLIPYYVRISLSSRFFSLLCEKLNSILHAAPDDNREWQALEVLLDLLHGFDAMVSAKASSFSVLELDDVDEEDKPSSIVASLVARSKELRGRDKSASTKFSCLVALLATWLQLQLHGPGRPEDILEDDDPDADDGNDAEDICEILGDVKQIADALLGGSVELDPLQGLAELCVSILSSPLAVGDQSRGSAPKLLREVVKATWASGLTLVCKDKKAVLDESVMTVLMSAIGIDEDSMDVDEGDSSDEDDSASDSEDAVFTKASKIMGDSDSEDSDSNSQSNESDSENSSKKSQHEDVELDPTKLQSFLEEDSDHSIEEGVLEHHAGADAALAKLIRLKQEARKAGQQAKERLVVAQQQRCLVLLETAVLGKPEGWGSLLRVEEVLHSVIPLIQHRRDLEKSVSNLAENAVGRSEKRGLMERIASILKTKIFKIKTATLSWTEGFNQAELASSMASHLLSELRSNSTKEHQACCNGALSFVLKALTDVKSKVSVAQIYAEAVPEWSTKKTTRLDSSFLDSFIQSHPLLAQVVLTKPTVEASKTARSSFLKSEAFRVLSVLYNAKLNTGGEDELSRQGLQQLDASGDQVMQSITASLSEDEDMKKSKRVRELLKATGKIMAYLLARVDDQSSEISLTCGADLEIALDSLSQSSDAKGVTQSCAKIAADIATLSSKLKATKTSTPSSSSKKKKKKKKKR